MKKLFLMLLVALSTNCFSQDSIAYVNTHAQIFSLSPISKEVDSVNGVVFGLGHLDKKNIKNQTINGLNLEANPAPLAGALATIMLIPYLPKIMKDNAKKHDTINDNNFVIKNWNYTPNLKINGLNLSTGCFFTTTSMNGLNISLGNKFKNFNGLSITPLGTIADKLNGVSIGVINLNTDLKGVSFGLYNQTNELKGFQIGIVNQVQNRKGIQIGIFNKSYSRGFQLGIWNTNKDRSFPFLNW
jgi:hypothetical protein